MNQGMSQEEFQNYLGLLGRLLRLSTAQREAIEDELRTHMEERLAALTSQGIEPQRAVSMALAEFGDAAALAAEFSAVSRLQRRRWMMRFTIGSIAAAVLLVAVVALLWPEGSAELSNTAAHAQQVEKSPPAPPSPQEEDPNAKTQAKLEALGQADFVNTPLSDVLDFLADLAKVQIHVDKRSLADVGIVAEEAQVTLSLKDVPVEMLLRLALKELDLGYALDHGVVVVTSKEQADANLEIRVYRVRDLIDAPAGPAAIQSAGGDPTQPPARSDAAVDAADELIALITSTVQPENWDEVGGPATIREYRGALVVSQTYAGQRDVAKLLEDLREAMGK